MHRRAESSTVRGCLAGVTMAVLAVAAHGTAGGGHPGSTGLTLLLLAAAVIGAVAAAVHSPVTLPVLMVLGQPVCHVALGGLTQHGHAAGAMDFMGTGVMAAAHTVAALVFAVMILVAERLYVLVSQTVRAVLTRPAGLPVPSLAGRWATVAAEAKGLLALGANGSRAPPVAV
ncbi:MAG: hypothetical protein JWN03_1259 [Nocardia sp.]|uniref:hypothetical protein n=1 Tax=Nocardia sp. TaxID=1821 RepID=UPI00262014EC|nr:hypothetical protein [Nocardia sp.]MCU1640984.1 hypothetical protein [Nocardia sp.]